MKPKFDTWINFKTTKEQKEQIKLEADLCEISQSEFIREAIDCHTGGCEPANNSKRNKTYNFALTKDEIKVLITATSRAYDPVASKLHGIFVRASESIESGNNMKREQTNNVQA